MSVKAVELVVVPLVFEHGRNYRIKCYTSSVRITGHGVDDDAWGRSWAIGERSHIGTSRSNRVNDLHVSIPLVDSPVEPPTDVPAVAEDIHVSLAWGDRVTARRSTTDDTCTFALHFGDREATTWQALKGASLWFSSDADGRLAFIVGSCPSRRPTSVSLTFPADREYKAALYGDISFNLRASALPAILGRLTEREPLDEEQQPALHEQGLAGTTRMRTVGKAPLTSNHTRATRTSRPTSAACSRASTSRARRHSALWKFHRMRSASTP
jgi:hypothetical protein